MTQNLRDDGEEGTQMEQMIGVRSKVVAKAALPETLHHQGTKGAVRLASVTMPPPIHSTYRSQYRYLFKITLNLSIQVRGTYVKIKQ